MSACRSDIKGLLPEFVNGFLDPERSGKVTDHLHVCRECALEVQAIRQFSDEDLPDPGPWFYESLPGKVTAEIEARRKRKMRMLLPVWAGGIAAAVLAAVMFLVPGVAPDLQTAIPEYASLEAEGFFSMGFEEEILSAPGILVDELDQVIGQDLGTVSEAGFFTMTSILEGDVYEAMDEETITVFETLLEEMIQLKIRRKVIS